jgi:hypothetical protein
MIFETTTTLEEDLAVWLKWHGIQPYKEIIDDFKRTLQTALKQDEGILACLDSYVKSDKPIKASEGRNYERENITRIMREKNVQEEEAKQILIERKAKGTYRQICFKNRKVDYLNFFLETEKPEGAKFAIATKHDVFFFKSKLEAHLFLAEKYGYKTTDSARTVFIRSIKKCTAVHKQGWQAFEIK